MRKAFIKNCLVTILAIDYFVIFDGNSIQNQLNLATFHKKVTILPFFIKFDIIKFRYVNNLYGEESYYVKS